MQTRHYFPRRILIVGITLALLVILVLTLTGVLFTKAKTTSEEPVSSRSMREKPEREEQPDSPARDFFEGTSEAEPEQGDPEQELTEYMTVSFIDVGMADCTWIRVYSAEGVHDMLIDAGNYEDGALVAAYLLEQSVTRFDYVLVTHGHEDHCGGIQTVLNAIPADTVFFPNTPSDGYWYECALEAAGSCGATVAYPTLGMVCELGNAHWQVLCCDDSTGMTSSSGGHETDGLNLSSVVIKLTYGDIDFMLTGDCEQENEREMLHSGYDLRCEILKAAHHGSKTSNSKLFLRDVHAESVVITSEQGNEYGLPSRDVEMDLAIFSDHIYRTAELGTVLFTTDGNTYSVKTAKTNTNGEKS